jgi:FAD:protein FMN transferase
LVAVGLLGSLPPGSNAEWVGEAIDLMGTRVSVELWHEDAAAGRALVGQVLALYAQVDEDMSTYRPDSEISLVNREAATRAVPVGPELFAVIERAIALSAASGGAFDITYESVGYLYDFRERRAPDDAQIAARIDAIDYRHLVLDRDARTVRFTSPGVRINLGGIAKGYAVERSAELLREAGVRYALLNAGGDTRVLGDRRGQPWMVGIRHPRVADGVVTRLPLVDEAISTSGDYERYFEQDGRRIHHIIDPGSGRPVEGILSATVIGPDATLTDGLATTVFVLGVERGLALIERFESYEAVIIDSGGRFAYSSGLAAEDP